MKKPRPIAVKQDDVAPVPVEVMADAIRAIGDGVKVLRRSRLNDKALILLIQHACPTYGPRHGKVRPTTSQVEAVIAGIEALEREYLKPVKP